MASPSEISRPRRNKTPCPTLAPIDGSELALPRPHNRSASSPDLKALSLSVDFRGWRFASKKFRHWVHKLSKTHEPTWRKAGIFEAIMASTKKIHKDTSLVLAVAEKWCPGTKSFLFPWGEATITLEDVMLLLGFSVLGSPVSEPLERSGKKTKAKLEEVCLQIRNEKGFGANEKTWVRRFMDTGHELEHVAFLALWLSYFVFPSTYYHLTEDSLSVAVHLSTGTRIALAPAVLAHLYAELTLLRDHIRAFNGSVIPLKIDLSALFKLVQVWTWERGKSMKRAREDDESTMVRCQTQIPSDNDDEVDDKHTLAQWLNRRFRETNSDVEQSEGDDSEPLGKKSRLEVDNDDSGPSLKLASLGANGVETVPPTEIEQRNEDTGETGSKAGMNMVLSHSDENNFSDPPAGFDGALDIDVPPPETMQACDDDDLDVHGTNVDKETMLDDGSKEPDSLLHEDGVVVGADAYETVPETEQMNEETIEGGREAEDINVLIPSDENKSSDPPIGANGGVDIVVPPPETMQTCDDDDLDVHGTNAEKETMLDDGSKEPDCLLHEDGVIVGADADETVSETEQMNEGGREVEDINVLIPSDENKSSDTPIGANGEGVDIVVSPPETKKTCDYELDICGSNADMFYDGSKEPVALMADNNESNPRQELACEEASGDETSKTHASMILCPSEESNINIIVGDATQGQDRLVHENDADNGSKEPECLIQEDGVMTGESQRSDEKASENLVTDEQLALKADNNESPSRLKLASESANGDETREAYKQSLHRLEVMAKDVEERIEEALKNVAWLKARRAMKRRNMASFRLI